MTANHKIRAKRRFEELQAKGDQISFADVLANSQGKYDAIHIVSHGNQGELKLGSGSLNTESLAGEYADELAVIGESLCSSRTNIWNSRSSGIKLLIGLGINLLDWLNWDFTDRTDAPEHGTLWAGSNYKTVS